MSRNNVMGIWALMRALMRSQTRSQTRAQMRVPMWLRPWVLAILALGPALLAWAAGPPAWAVQPPRDTPEWFYGVGEAPDLEGARRLALRAVAARLRSSVSGRVESTVTDNNGRVNSVASSAVAEDVLKTEFTRAEVEKSQAGGVGVFVLVKVDRNAFISDTKSQLEVIAAPVHAVEAALPQQSSLEQFIALRRVATQLEQARVLSQLLQGAGLQAEGQQRAARYGALIEQSKKVAGSLAFELSGKPEDADVLTAVGGFLAAQGMRSARTRTPGANLLSIDCGARQDDLFGTKIVKLNVRLALQDAQGRAVASREVVVSGSSRYDFAAARKAAVDKLEADLKSAGMVRALGLSE